MIVRLKILAKLVVFLTLLICAVWFSTFHVNSATIFPKHANTSVAQLQEMGRDLGVAPPFPPNLPHGRMLKPVGEVLQQLWARDLYLFLKRMDSKQITIVSANFGYTQQLLNWLINACVLTKMPCNNVLVLAFDQPLHMYLQSKQISSIYINRHAFIMPKVRMNTPSSYIYLIRFAVMRVINFWGYDVLSVDLDAIVQKNLSTLFEKYGDEDIIGSVGHYPFDLNKKWGVTLCMGAVLIRYTPHTELVWDISANGTIQDDQMTINYILNDLGVEWHQAKTPNEDYCVQGFTPQGLKVTILSNSVVCRSCTTNSLGTYYIWHKRASKSFEAKHQQAAKANLWLLDPKWNYTSDSNKSLTGLEWLNSLFQDADNSSAATTPHN